MTNALALLESEDSGTEGDTQQQFVSIRVNGQLFGMPITAVRDVLKYRPTTPIPLAPKEIVGAFNLRGRIVIAIDMRKRLQVSSYSKQHQAMMILVEFQGELFALMVDAVDDVVSLNMNQSEKLPGNLDPVWRSFSTGIFRLADELMIALDIPRVIDGMKKVAA